MLAWFLIALLAVAVLAPLATGHKAPEHLVPPFVALVSERPEHEPETHAEIRAEDRAIHSTSGSPSSGNVTVYPGPGRLKFTALAPTVTVGPAA